MAVYLAPGVYVEEVSGGARPIEAVGTSTAGFLGNAPAANHLREPKAVTSYAAFQRLYPGSGAAPNVLATAVAGFFANGGSYCYVVNLGPKAKVVKSEDLLLLDAMEGISLIAAPGYVDAESYEAIIGDCERRGDRFAILETPPDFDGNERPARPRQSDRGHAAVYTPWIETLDAETGERVAQPPAGHLAGLFSRTDAERGVHKAPANAPIVGALGLTRAISSAEQERLNPVGVNCIRVFSNGLRVWGARTLADSSSEWRYVPVRRLVTMISQSVERGTRWVVFEPNDLSLWKSIRRDISAFLHALWRDGALAGAKPEDAFFVRCDSTTTTQADIDAGRVVALVGIAPVRPAEFVIIRIGQSAGQSQVEEG